MSITTKREEFEAKLVAVTKKRHEAWELHEKLKAEADKLRSEVGRLRWMEADEEKAAKFKALGEEHGILNHPKFKDICERAYDNGHSEGWEHVGYIFADLADL